jgi:thiol-disulfide isomerase/thioredoxin
MKKILIVAVTVFGFALNTQAQKIHKVKMDEVVSRFSQKNDTIYVVNFWATFCKPCVAELPNFLAITKKYKTQKVKLILVSLDLPSYYPAKIASFAKAKKYKAEIMWLDETNADHFCPMIDKKWSGAIPSTIMVNAKTGYKKFFEEEMKAEEFETALKAAITGN